MNLINTTQEKDVRFDFYQFDSQTWVVVDKLEQKEICICSDYDDSEDGVDRAKKIALLLNQSN